MERTLSHCASVAWPLLDLAGPLAEWTGHKHTHSIHIKCSTITRYTYGSTLYIRIAQGVSLF